MSKENVKRFDIYLYDFGHKEGSIQSGLRPVMVIQDDRMNENSPTTIVAAITSAAKKLYLPSHVFIGQAYGLEKPSMVLMEQIQAVNQVALIKFIGHVSDDHMRGILSNAAKKALGFWSYEPKDRTAVRCLCPSCLDAYKSADEYIVRRLDPFQKAKEACDLCSNLGWDYIVTQRKHKHGTQRLR